MYTGWWFGTFVIFPIILGMSSSQLTFIFFRGVGRYTTNQFFSAFFKTTNQYNRYTLWLFNVASGKWPIYRWFTMVYRLKVVAKIHQPAHVIPRPHDPNCARMPEFWQNFCGFIRPDETNHRTWYQPWDLCKSMISMSCHDP